MNNLDKSWNRFYHKDFGDCRRSMQYVNGASDFQNKAIEELEKYFEKGHPDYIGRSYFQEAIQIIKELKAE